MSQGFFYLEGLPVSLKSCHAQMTGAALKVRA